LEKSLPTPEYNCIAFAVGDTSIAWWPNNEDSYWPSEEEGVPQEETVAALFAAYKVKKRYSLCEAGDLEPGFEKIAIFANAQGVPTHAAHQRSDGKWESKLGAGIDIWHDSLDELAGPLYGQVVHFLKRSTEAVEHEQQ
jgi:hypothetical protein